MEIVLGLMVSFLIGWAFMWAIQQALNPHCPECGGAVPNGVTKCRHCGTSFGGPIIAAWRLQIRPSILLAGVVTFGFVVFLVIAILSGS